VIPIGITRDGAWFIADPSNDPFRAEGRPVDLVVPEGILRSGSDHVEFDVVFPVLHGPYGEDGTVQGLFDTVGVPYVGCGVLPSALAMDKDIAKRLLRDAGIPTPDWVVVRGDEFSDDPHRVVTAAVDRVGLPAFVKPAALGSSVGVALASTEGAVKDAIEQALRHGDKVVVEEAIVGREIEVAVLDGPRVSLPGEILLEAGWYDSDAKYRSESSRFEVPANLTDARVGEVQALAGKAFSVLECRGLARVDFFLEQSGRGFLINEVNTMPGFTPISGFPKMWEASGMSYPELCDALVAAAMA
jgi:D-alanine-D-alanine ligase